jgi:hypothetical protein
MPEALGSIFSRGRGDHGHWSYTENICFGPKDIPAQEILRNHFARERERERERIQLLGDEDSETLTVK